ncbi:MAG: nucleotidyltransferase domain-containing protein [Muribaculaceae bacterium]|nr:nucleotidyltransferase domain-containing protein [Muribaculaceae bacterium]
MHLVETNIHKIIEICKRFHVRKLWAFGSILTNRFNEKSDVDLCVDFDKSQIPPDRFDIEWRLRSYRFLPVAIDSGHP